MALKYRYNFVEILSYGFDMVRQALVKFWKLWLAIVAVVVAANGISLLGAADGTRHLANYVEMVEICLFMIAGVLGVLFLSAVILMERRFHGKELGLTLEGGNLVLLIGESRWQHSCTEIAKIEKRGMFIAIELSRIGEENATILVPRRVFAGTEEQQRFLDFAERQRGYARQMAGSGWQVGTTVISGGENEREPVDFDFETQWDDTLESEVKAEVAWIGAQKEFGGDSRWLVCLILGVVWLGMLVRELVTKNGQPLAMVFTGAIMVLVLWVLMRSPIMGGLDRATHRKLQAAMLKPKQKRHESTVSRIVVDKQKILVLEGTTEAKLSWKDMVFLLESGPWFLIYNDKKQPILHFPKWSLGDEDEQSRFVSYCQERGLAYREMSKSDAGESEKRGRSVMIPLIVIVLAIFFLIVFAVRMIFQRSGMEAREETVTYAAETAEYVFHQEDFEDYLPLEKQVGVLKSLGIRVPESVLKDERDWMAEYPTSQEWIEGNPFYTVLEDLGYPEYDEESYEVKSYSSQMYTVDWELYDLTEDYTSLLHGVNAISKGEYALTSPAVLLDDIDGNSLTGTVQLYFLLNGKPYLYELESDGYSLDTAVLRYLNEALGREKVPGRLYGMDDGGWNCVLFYGDKAWAGEFSGKTGIPLVLEYVGE